VLVLLAVMEATVFPAPTEAFLVALALGRPKRAWWLGALAAGSSVSGGLIGYWLGTVSFDSFGRPLIESLGLLPQLDLVAGVYRDNAFIALATSGYTPVPYLLYTMAAGAFDVPLVPFVLGSLVGRSLKYLPLVVLVYVFGPRVRQILDRYAPWVAGGFVVLLLAWFAFMV
jgi:membrane protein YqaA with SNARE-associated domain